MTRISILTLLALAACGPSTLTFEAQNLDPLADGFVYEAWLIKDGTPTSAGRFAGDEASPSLALSVDDADAFVLTIEPATGDDPAPSDVHILGGDFVDGIANLSIGHKAALGDDFAGGAGSFILETPTTMTVDDDYNQGVWFVALDLPTLPAGWVYEGWVVGDDGPVSTGRFTDVNAQDDDGAGSAAGADGFPAKPGQDFIDPARDLVGAKVVLSIEPEPDTAAGPFALKPWVADVSDVGQAGMITLPNAGIDISATATIQ